MDIEFITFMVYAGFLGLFLAVAGKYWYTWQFWAWDIPLLIVGRLLINLLFRMF